MSTTSSSSGSHNPLDSVPPNPNDNLYLSEPPSPSVYIIPSSPESGEVQSGLITYSTRPQSSLPVNSQEFVIIKNRRRRYVDNFSEDMSTPIPTVPETLTSSPINPEPVASIPLNPQTEQTQGVGLDKGKRPMEEGVGPSRENPEEPSSPEGSTFEEELSNYILSYDRHFRVNILSIIFSFGFSINVG